MNNSNRSTTALVFASGYAGQETLDRVLGHPELELVALGSDSLAGKAPAVLDSRLGGNQLPHFVTNEAALSAGADLVLLCGDHRRVASVVSPPGAVVVDLSGAHRLQDPAAYEEWYGFAHPQPGDLAKWAYSIPEIAPPAGRLIANPGCYATAALLALMPLVGAIDESSVVIDAKSGVSGAGRAPSEFSQATQVLENLTAYRVGHHQHAIEISEALGFDVCFVPHLVPIRRGLIVTCYARATGDARDLLENAYAATPAVTLLDPGAAPDLARVHGTDRAEVALFQDRMTRMLIVMCALDNLGKGAAGQAIQNANLALGHQETLGLKLRGVPV